MDLKDLKDVIGRTPRKEHDLDIDSDDLGLQRLKKKLEALRYSSDTTDRKWLAIWTAGIVTLWLGAVVFVLLFNDHYFCLSDSVLVTLLGTTTLNVLGLSFIVLRGHFRNDKEVI